MRTRGSLGLITGIVVLAVAGASLSSFWRVSRIQKNNAVLTSTVFPLIKQFQSVHGKWSGYQRSFEQFVSFKNWGKAELQNSARFKVSLNRLLETEVDKIRKILAENSNFVFAKEITERLIKQAKEESLALASLEVHLKNKNFSEAASIYTKLRQDHSDLTLELNRVLSDLETSWQTLQNQQDEEVQNAQVFMLFLFFTVAAITALLLFNIRKWVLPVSDWIRFAQEVSKKGISREIKFPAIQSKMLPEIALLTRELTQMGKTVLQQKEELERFEHFKKITLAANFSAQVAHEIRNPLNTILLNLELLEDENPGAAKRIAVLQDQIEKLERLTKKYLDIHPRKMEFLEGNLSAVVQEAISFLQAEISRHCIEVKCELLSPSKDLMFDRDALFQVLVNLLKNSIEALALAQPSKRTIHIRSTQENKDVFIHIVDSGTGLSEKIRTRCFEPYVTTKTSGHGLGLSISRQLCLEQAGDLRCVPLPPNAGAHFEIRLPLREGV